MKGQVSRRMASRERIRNNLLDCMNVHIRVCELCPLHKGRKNVVPGAGNPVSSVVFFGEGPGANEDEQGLPFVGKAGKMLDAMIASIDLTRDQVFILNAVKCRPPGNRKPTPEEIDACRPYFEMQLEVIRPEVIVTLGATATEALCGPGRGITKRRGHWEKYLDIPVMPTLHPAYLLRNPAAKGDAWEDFQKVKAVYGALDE